MEGDWTRTARFLVGLVMLRQPAAFREAHELFSFLFFSFLFFFFFANKLWGIFEPVKKFRPLTA